MKNKESRDIWDIMFSLDKSYFPLSRNYLQEPRGSSNPINSQVKMKPKKEFLEFAAKQNIVDLYAFDFELNILFRKLVDFILFASKEDVYGWDIIEEPEYLEELFKYSNHIEKTVFDSSLNLSVHDMIIDAYSIAPFHILGGEAPSEHISNEMRDVAEFQFAVQYYIENSNLSWRTKAEAFLRSNYLNNFSDADDETLIYLNKKIARQEAHPHFLREDTSEFDFIEFDKQNSISKSIKTSADIRWNQYNVRWNLIGAEDKNPFIENKDISGLRYIDSNYLPFLGYLIYESESQHLLSSENISKFCRMMNVLRTDLQSIKQQIYHFVELLKKYLFIQVKKFGFNYTVTDRTFLICLVYHYLNRRLDSVPYYDDDFKSTARFLLGDPWTAKLPEQTRSSMDFISCTSLLPLVCLNVQAIWFSKPEGALPYIDKRLEQIIKEQNVYGYWFDHCNSPEFSTVLALDTLDIQKEIISSPLTTIKLFDSKSVPTTMDTRVAIAYDAQAWSLTVGSQRIMLTAKQLDLFEQIIASKSHGVGLEITKKHQDARTYLKKKLKNPKLIDKIIHTGRVGRKIRYYELGSDVQIKNHPNVTMSYGWDMDDIDPHYSSKRTKTKPRKDNY